MKDQDLGPSIDVIGGRLFDRFLNKGELPAEIAWLYVNGYGEPPWNEEHDMSATINKVDSWLGDGEHICYTIEKSGKVVAFGMSHFIKLSEAYAQIEKEMSEVSGVHFDPEQERVLKNRIQEALLNDPNGRVCVIQDIVVDKEYRRSDYYLQILNAMLDDSIQDPVFDDGSVALHIAYTHPGVKAVVQTMISFFGIEPLIESTGKMLFAANREQIDVGRAKIKRLLKGKVS